MIVVSNTTPLNYLVILKLDHVLPALFETVTAPPVVAAELSSERSPEAVRRWISAPPAWLRIQAPRVVDTSLDLDGGEREAIALAIELRADRILLDDLKARQVAAGLGLRVAGTLAVLVEGSQLGFVELKPALAALKQSSFYLSEQIERELLRRADSPRQ